MANEMENSERSEQSEQPTTKPKYKWYEHDPDDPTRMSLSQMLQMIPNVYDVDKEPRTKMGVRPESDDHVDWRGVRRSDHRELPMPPENHPSRHDPYDKYYYFDTPDYADPFAKMWFATKWSALAGFAAFTNLEYFEPHKTSKAYLKGVATGTARVMAVSLIISGSTICFANFRGKKDDFYNWIGGGFVASLCLGNSYGWPAWWKGCIYIIPSLIMLKNMNEGNYNLFTRKGDFSRVPATGKYGASAHDFWSGDFRFGARSNHVDRARRPM